MAFTLILIGLYNVCFFIKLNKIIISNNHLYLNCCLLNDHSFDFYILNFILEYEH
jgi:hypothetical protein